MNQFGLIEDAPYFPKVAEGPDNVDAYWIKAEDDVRLRVAQWRAESSPKSTIFLFQGRTENIEKYGRTAEAFHNEGYVVFAIDWRGQGLSDRLTDDPMTGHIGLFSDYQKDVAAMNKAAVALDLPKPWYLIGHSLGACVGLRAIIKGLPVSACAFTAPLWGVNLSNVQRLGAWSLSWAAQLMGKGHAYAPGTRGESYVLHTAFEDNRLTHDPEMYQYYINISESLADQQIGGPSMGWLFQVLKETRSLSKLRSPDTPCITFCGAEDSIVESSAAHDRMDRWPHGKLEIVENARHDVLYEVPSIRNEVLVKISRMFSST